MLLAILISRLCSLPNRGLYHSPTLFGVLQFMFNLKQFSLSVALFTVAGTACATSTFSTSVQAATVVDSVNASNFPVNDGCTWFASEVGWSYTPRFSYNLSGINTKFGEGVGVMSKPVMVEVYDKAPTTGGTLLRSASFTATANAFSGGIFAALNLLAGEDYFIGFRNVNGLGVNFTQDAGAVALNPFQFGFGNSGSYSSGSSNGASLN